MLAFTIASRVAVGLLQIPWVVARSARLSGWAGRDARRLQPHRLARDGDLLHDRSAPHLLQKLRVWNGKRWWYAPQREQSVDSFRLSTVVRMAIGTAK